MDPLTLFRERLSAPRVLVGMVHVGALPGTPHARHSVPQLVERAVAEARIFREAGFTAVAIENMHDRPYVKGPAAPEVTAAMTAIGREVKRETGMPLGVQILAGANREALAVAHACDAEFVRVEGFVFAHVADEGIIESCAGDLLRYRRAIGAARVLVLADIKKKHSAHALTADVPLGDTARAAELFLADGVIVTGAATGQATSPADVEAVVGEVGIPVLVGSGVTPENLCHYQRAHGFIVGSSVKEAGDWSRPIDRARVRAIVRAFGELPPPA